MRDMCWKKQSIKETARIPQNMVLTTVSIFQYKSFQDVPLHTWCVKTRFGSEFEVVYQVLSQSKRHVLHPMQVVNK